MSNRSAFTKLDKTGFEYATQLKDLSVKEMHVIMWLLGKRKNKQGYYFIRDKEDVYRTLLDNIDGMRDTVKNKINSLRNKSNISDLLDQLYNDSNDDIKDERIDFSDMKTASDYYLHKDIYESFLDDEEELVDIDLDRREFKPSIGDTIFYSKKDVVLVMKEDIESLSEEFLQKYVPCAICCSLGNDEYLADNKIRFASLSLLSGKMITMSDSLSKCRQSGKLKINRFFNQGQNRPAFVDTRRVGPIHYSGKRTQKILIDYIELLNSMLDKELSYLKNKKIESAPIKNIQKFKLIKSINNPINDNLYMPNYHELKSMTLNKELAIKYHVDEYSTVYVMSSTISENIPDYFHMNTVSFGYGKGENRFGNHEIGRPEVKPLTQFCWVCPFFLWDDVKHSIYIN